MSFPSLDDHFFRHAFGKLTALLAHRFGVEHLVAIEDAVQSALLRALENWTSGVPENPLAWLFKVAQNRLLSELRQTSKRSEILSEQYETMPKDTALPEARMSGELNDELLRMLFACCDDAIPQASQLVLALKTLCGFSIPEIAHRLFASEANVYKRLARARQRLQEHPSDFQALCPKDYPPRIPSVNKILYVLFTEGYLSTNVAYAMRRELCDEAIRLGSLLVEGAKDDLPETNALLALMYFHRARMSAREDGTGGLLLLEHQDRTLWHQQDIQRGLFWLEKSAQGDSFSRYHAEAGIAAEHCLAPSFCETRWEKIVECYALLEQTSPSAIHRLNRAVAEAEWRGPDAGLEVIKCVEPPTWLVGSYMWSAVLADLYRRAGQVENAEHYRAVALNNAPTPAVKDLLEQRLSLVSRDA